MPSTKNWFEVRNQAASHDQPVEILIYDQIGKDWWDGSGVAAKDFAEALSEIDRDQEIVVCINSPGGSVWDGLAIYHLLQARADRVTTRIDGLAASIASVVAMAGKECQMPANAMIMIHDPSALVAGGAADMRKMADRLDKHSSLLAGIYHSKSGASIKDIQEKMTAETWFTGEDAKEFGLVDTVTEIEPIEASFDLSLFKHAPNFSHSSHRRSLDSRNTPNAKTHDRRFMTEEKSVLSRIRNMLKSEPVESEETVPISAYVLLETGHKDVIAKLKTAEIDLTAARLQVTNLEKDKSDLTTKVADLEAAAAKAKTDLEVAIKEHGGRESAAILAKLGVTPVKVEPDSGKPTDDQIREQYHALIKEGKSREAGQLWAKHRVLFNR